MGSDWPGPPALFYDCSGATELCETHTEEYPQGQDVA